MGRGEKRSDSPERDVPGEGAWPETRGGRMRMESPPDVSRGRQPATRAVTRDPCGAARGAVPNPEGRRRGNLKVLGMSGTQCAGPRPEEDDPNPSGKGASGHAKEILRGCICKHGSVPHGAHFRESLFEDSGRVWIGRDGSLTDPPFWIERPLMSMPMHSRGRTATPPELSGPLTSRLPEISACIPNPVWDPRVG
jgi:hypothetical protein